ncbi:IPTL-CTERM sorting domain-containing protein, partial [Ottowia sp.]
SAPAAGLCSAGSPSAVTGGGPWSWSCSGGNGGGAAACTAPAMGVKTYSAPSPTGTGTITAQLSGGGDACGFAPGTRYVASEPAATPATPPGVAFPHGLFDFSATQCGSGEGTSSITLDVTYPEALPAGTRYYKWGPTPGNATPHWYEMPATISGRTASFTITDGGLGDDDLQANGTIVDQGGAGVGGAGTGAGVTGIPALSEWALVLMASLLALAGIQRGKRRR